MRLECELQDMVSMLSVDVTLKRKPRNGKEAYVLLVESLETEIKEKQEILSELSSDDVKRKFISGWSAKTKGVTIRD